MNRILEMIERLLNRWQPRAPYHADRDLRLMLMLARKTSTNKLPVNWPALPLTWWQFILADAEFEQWLDDMPPRLLSQWIKAASYDPIHCEYTLLFGHPGTSMVLKTFGFTELIPGVPEQYRFNHKGWAMTVRLRNLKRQT